MYYFVYLEHKLHDSLLCIRLKQHTLLSSCASNNYIMYSLITRCFFRVIWEYILVKRGNILNCCQTALFFMYIKQQSVQFFVQNFTWQTISELYQNIFALNDFSIKYQDPKICYKKMQQVISNYLQYVENTHTCQKFE